MHAGALHARPPGRPPACPLSCIPAAARVYLLTTCSTEMSVAVLYTQLYTQFAADNVNAKGLAAWLLKESNEEKEHALQLAGHMVGGCALCLQAHPAWAPLSAARVE